MDDKYLLDNELFELNLKQKDQEILKLKRKDLEKEISILTLKKEMIELTKKTFDLEILKLKIQLDSLNVKNKDLLTQSKEFNDFIKNKYTLPEKWGYDPESGKLI